MTFSEIQTLLTALGWTVEQGKSSHVMLVSPRNSTITIATVKSRKIKRTYVRLILKEIERDERL
jgi:predicted RNA binding protein YcfA (HicA-like mRNA interferase family)